MILNKSVVSKIIGIYFIIISLCPAFGSQWYFYEKNLSQRTYQSLENRITDVSVALDRDGLINEADRDTFELLFDDYKTSSRSYKKKYIDGFQWLSFFISIMGLITGILYFLVGVLIIRRSKRGVGLISYAILTSLLYFVLLMGYTFGQVTNICVSITKVTTLGSYINPEIVSIQLSFYQFLGKPGAVCSLMFIVILYFILPVLFARKLHKDSAS